MQTPPKSRPVAESLGMADGRARPVPLSSAEKVRFLAYFEQPRLEL
jgi:hypothetical protein